MKTLNSGQVYKNVNVATCMFMPGYRLLFLILLITFQYFPAQSQSTQVKKEQIFEYHQVDILPKYEGSTDFKPAVYSVLQWPDKFDGEGIVSISFVISSSGQLEQTQIINGLCASCDENAVLALSELSEWTPGQLNGRNVATRMYVDIQFRINGIAELIRTKTDGMSVHNQFFEIEFPRRKLVKVELFIESMNTVETLIEATDSNKKTVIICFRSSLENAVEKYPSSQIVTINQDSSGYYELRVWIDGQFVQKRRFLYIK